MFTIDLKKSAEPAMVRAGTFEDLQLFGRMFAPVAGILVALSIAFSVVDRRVDRSIEAQESRIVALEASVAENKQRLAELSGKTRTLYEGQRPEIYWSDELRLLSEVLPDKVWLAQVRATSTQTTKGPQGDVVTPGVVLVDGGVLSNANEGNLDVIGDFMRKLQADPRFQESFASVSLDSVQRASEPNTLNFRLRIAFR